MIFLADLPPPVHGMSNVNIDIYEVFQKHGYKIKLLNTAPSKKAKFFRSKIWPTLKAIQSITSLFKLAYYLIIKKHKTIYRPINGGKGQVYDIAYFAVSRLCNAEIFIHHHATRYLNQDTILFRVLLRTAGKSATHIVLGQSMTDSLSSNFGVPLEKILILSNCYFFNLADSNQAQSLPKQTLTIGHLSNLCIEKGIDSFALLCRKLTNLRIPFNANIAGPFADEHAQKITLELCHDFQNISYLGPLYGKDKNTFFRDIDIFVLPSQNEAEPLVLYEAAQHGVFLVGGTVGCMKDVIDGLDGFSFSLENQNRWIESVANLIASDQHSIPSSKNRDTRLNRLEGLVKTAQQNMNELLKVLHNAETR